MSPCSKYRELIAQLALDAINGSVKRDLQAHVENCAECRHYLDEISALTEKLNAVEIRSDIQTSESFHRRVVGAVRDEARGSLWHTLLSQIQESFKTWRGALTLAGATAAILALSFFLLNSDNWRSPKSLANPGSQAQEVATPGRKGEIDPTVANYQRVAHRSLEKLDELLVSQGNRDSFPTPIYNAAMLARATVPD